MAEITPEMTVNDVLARFPKTVAVFNEFGIDSCCGGGVPLSVAVERDGVDVGKLIARLQTAIERA